MTSARPILLALSLDDEAAGIVATAGELAARLGAPIVVVHSIPARRFEGEQGMEVRIAEVKERIEPHLGPLREAGIEIQDVDVRVGHPAEVVIEAAPRIAAQMIVTGGGRPSTVRRWVIGSVAEAVVRRSTVPVWVARGASPVGRPLLCPVDLTPESEVGLEAAIAMARLLEMPLSLITVVSEESSNAKMGHDEATAREQIEQLVAGYDLDGLDVSITVRSGDPAEQIVDAAGQAGLIVVASRGYDPLIRDWLGPVSARALGHSQCSALLIRHLETGHEARERAISSLADLVARARQLVEDGRGTEALPLLERAAEQGSANAAIQETYAHALKQAGRAVEATSRQELAELIRDRIG